MCKNIVEDSSHQAIDTFSSIGQQLTADKVVVAALPDEIALGLTRMVAWRWLQTIQQNRDYFAFNLQLGSLYTKTGNLIENNTRRLFELDGVLTMGNPDLRARRKELVAEIQRTIGTLELHFARVKKLKTMSMVLFAKKPHDGQECKDKDDKDKQVKQGGQDEQGQDEQDEQGQDEQGQDEQDEQGQDEQGQDEQDEQRQDEQDEQGQDEQGQDEQDEQDQEGRGQHQQHQQHQQHRSLSPLGRCRASDLPGWSPACTVKQAGEYYVLEIDLPGLEIDQGDECKVGFEGRKLVAHGAKWPTHRDLSLLRQTGVASFGKFRLSMNLPRHCSAHGVDATLRNGRLLVHIPSSD
jgi:HSP20 family molecular chaperone IbpA